MKEKYLPIGTVVLLRDAKKRLMITGYCSALPEDPNNVYDYVACLFPEGNLAGEEVALFNHDKIGTIVHMGLVDDEFNNLNKQIVNAMAAESMPQPQMDLEPLTPTKINEILNTIKSNSDFTPIAEPTAFNEENLRKPLFSLSSMNNKDKSSFVKIEDFDSDENDEVIEENESQKKERVNDGQPVLQLQPIFTDGQVLPTDDSAPTTPSAIDMSGLTRL